MALADHRQPTLALYLKPPRAATIEVRVRTPPLPEYQWMPYMGKGLALGMSTLEQPPRSRWWYVLPIALSITGGLIAYFVLRSDDPPKAKSCLYVGIAMVAIDVAVVLALLAVGFTLL